MAALDLVPIHAGDRRDLVASLARRLQSVFGVAARVRPPWFDPESCYDPSRGQYDATALLAKLLEDPEGGRGRVIGVAAVDLFVPVLTFVFGQAQLDGRAAVVSLNRLRSEAYGLPRDDALLASRLEKEAIHELGHTFGLVHCNADACVMRASTYVEEIDLKGASFCASCLRAVRRDRESPRAGGR